MPEKRRTRATGFSPGGPQELDINAPTRRSRKTKTQASATPKDTPATTARTTRTRSGAKRKNREDVAEEPAAKKSRRQDPTERSEKITPHSQALSSVPDSGSDLPQESTSSSQEEEPAPEPEQLIDPRVNAQQPTPPLDTPGDVSAVQLITKTSQANLQEVTSCADAQRLADKKMKKEKRISDVIRNYCSTTDEQDEDAKPLSECDDEEWEERYSTVMEEARNPTPFIPTSKGESGKWFLGGNAMFIVRKPSKDIAAAEKSGPCMHRSILTPGFFSTMSRLAAIGPRPLTNIDAVVAVSASLDWYEKNPSIAAPTATEMTAMLDNFARAKQAQQSDAVNPVETQVLQNPTFDAPVTPKAQVASENLAEVPQASASDDGHSSIDEEEDAEMEQNGDLTADAQQNKVEATELQTPQRKDGLPGPRTWSSALSASAIGILTPLNNWFHRRNRDRPNIAATEPRPIKTQPKITGSAQPHQKPRSRNTPTHSNKTLLVGKSLPHDFKTTLASDSPTPAAPQPRRGRPDSHLPVHLRGVLFEDLPTEWQAVSQHLKKPQQVQVEDEDDEPVDMEYLLAIAKKTRKERERKELQEQAELIAQKQRDLESDDEFSGGQLDRKGKKRVTFSSQKTYSAKLGHSTFGMPPDIDETSSEEEQEDLGPQTHFGRNSRRSSRPMKSCLKRPYQQPKFEDYSEDDDQDGDEPRPAKKARLDEFSSLQNSEMLEDSDDIPPRGEGSESFLYEDDPHRARPFSRFISKPPSELRAAERAQMEFDRLNPKSRGPLFSSRVIKSPYQSDESNRRKVFGGSNRIPMEDWSAGFRTHLRPYTPIPVPFGRARRFYEAPGRRDEKGRLRHWPAYLEEVSQARLNQQREATKKPTDKVSSGLQAPHTSSSIQEKQLLKSIILDEEVLKSIALLDDDDIVAEGFGNYPDHAEATVSEEASFAIEWGPGTCYHLTPEERNSLTKEHLAKGAAKSSKVTENAEATESGEAAESTEAVGSAKAANTAQVAEV